MSFWTFGFHNVSAIETILEREEFTLDDLLDEEDILQEAKAQNARLLEFITQDEQLKKIIDYLTVEPAEDAEDRLKFKFPYICCEVLSAEVAALFDAIVNNQEYLAQIFSFLEKDEPLSTVLTPYVCRVAMVLIDRRSKQVIEFLKSRDNFISKLLTHISNASLIELILKLVSITPPEEDEVDVIGWLTETKLLSCLIDKFDPSLDEQVHENTATCLVEIIKACTGEKAVFVEQLASQENMTKMFTHLLTESPNTSGLLQGLAVLIHLMGRYQEIQHDFETPIEETPALIQATLGHCNTFHEMMVKGKNPRVFTSSIGELKQFGFYRLKLLEFFLSLVKTDYKCVHDKLLELKFFSTCLDLFFEYIWNNFLHHMVDDVMQVVFSGRNTALKLALLKDCTLLDRIIVANKGNDEDCEKPKGIRRGYMGNLTRISISVVEAIKQTPELEEFANQHPTWNAFVEKTLRPQQEIETKPLGGHKPTSFMQGITGMSLPHSVGMSQGDDNDDDDDDVDEDDEDEDDDEDNDLEFSDDTGFVPESFSSGEEASLDPGLPSQDDDIAIDDSKEFEPLVTPFIDEDPATEKVEDDAEETKDDTAQPAEEAQDGSADPAAEETKNDADQPGEAQDDAVQPATDKEQEEEAGEVTEESPKVDKEEQPTEEGTVEE